MKYNEANQCYCALLQDLVPPRFNQSWAWAAWVTFVAPAMLVWGMVRDAAYKMNHYASHGTCWWIYLLSVLLVFPAGRTRVQAASSDACGTPAIEREYREGLRLLERHRVADAIRILQD